MKKAPGKSGECALYVQPRIRGSDLDLHSLVLYRSPLDLPPQLPVTQGSAGIAVDRKSFSLPCPGSFPRQLM